MIRRPAADGRLDPIQLAYLRQGLRRDRRLGTVVDVEDLAPGVRPTADLDDPLTIELVEAGIGVGLQEAREAGQVRRRPFALAVRRKEEDRRRRAGITRRPVVADIDPQPPGLGAATAGIEYRHRRVVGMDLGRGKDVGGQPLAQRLQQPSHPSDPVGERRAVKFDAGSGVDQGLPIQRQMIAELGDQHLGQQPWSRPAALDRQRRHRRLVNALAGPAGEARPDVADHLELRRHVVENFRDVLADDVQLAAAGRTGAARRLVPAFLPRQMAGQRPAGGLLLGRGGRRCGLAVRRKRRDLLLDRLESKRQLIGMLLLRRTAELQPLQRRQKQLQLLQFGIPFGQPRLRRRQFGVLSLQHLGQFPHHPLQQDGIGWQPGKIETHGRLASAAAPAHPEKNQQSQKLRSYRRRLRQRVENNRPAPIETLDEHRQLRRGQRERPLLDLRPDEFDPAPAAWRTGKARCRPTTAPSSGHRTGCGTKTDAPRTDREKEDAEPAPPGHRSPCACRPAPATDRSCCRPANRSASARSLQRRHQPMQHQWLDVRRHAQPAAVRQLDLGQRRANHRRDLSRRSRRHRRRSQRRRRLIPDDADRHEREIRRERAKHAFPCQLPPLEQLIGAQAVTLRHQGYRRPRPKALGDNPQLLLNTPPAAPRDTGDHLDPLKRPSHKPSLMTNPSPNHHVGISPRLRC